MKGNPAISFTGGLIITAVILIVLYLLYLVSIFDLSVGETLQEIENQRTILLVLTIIIAGLTVLVSRRFIRAGKKYTAIGTVILPLLALLAVTVSYFNNFNYHTTFNHTTWQQDMHKPFDMAATLVKDKVLIGMTRIEVEEMLGQGHEKSYGDQSQGNGYVSYLVEHSWTLIIYFEKDIVVDTKLRLPYMMTSIKMY
ncbi:MAG: hypothetical protein KDC12_15815 [Flavobacteriales bacterium]|nr:hypothetical protein [Flavobacteriales bacterium]